MYLVRPDAHLVLAVPSAKFLLALLRLSLDKHFEALSNIPPVALERQSVLQGDDFLEPASLGLNIHVIRIFARCKRARPF